MTTIMRSLFPSKRRKTEDITTSVFAETSRNGNGLLPSSSSSISLSGLLRNAVVVPLMSSSSSAPIRVTNNNMTANGHRRQHSTGSFNNFVSPPPASERNRQRSVSGGHEANNNNNNDLIPMMPYLVPMSKLCKKSFSTITPSNLRMVIIEADQRVLYDTMTVIPVRHGLVPNAKTLSPCKEFQFLRRRKDTKHLAQLLFGAVPVATGSESFKIHVLEEEDQILVSKVFFIPRSSKNAQQPETSDAETQNTVKSVDGWMRTHITRSTTSTPETFSRVRHISINFGDEDDAASSSPTSSNTLPRAFSPPHRLSRNRRRQMAHKTSLCENSSFAIPSSLKSRSRLSSIGSQINDDDHHHSQEGRQIALGLLFPGAQRHFLFKHMPLIEAEMSRFENRIMTAAGHPPTFLHNISKAWDEIAGIICNLHNAPRLKNPVWLTLNENPRDEKCLARQFCNQLSYLIHKFDTKEQGYFLSNLITAVLMHHMSWVASVATPPLRPDIRRRYANSMKNFYFGMNLNEDAHSVGYNAQMAQYLELNGNVGLHRSAKVLVCGEDADIVTSLCQILTYFIRCSAVKHIDDDRLWQLPIEQKFSPINAGVSGRMAFSPDKIDDDQFVDEFLPPRRTRKSRINNYSLNATSTSSSSSSAESIPTVVAQSTQICVVETESSSSITIINRLEYPCCGNSCRSDDEEDLNPEDIWAPRSTSDGLGKSLFAGPLNSYCPHFVVSGLSKDYIGMPELISKIFDEVRCTYSPCHRAVATASISSSQSSSSVSDVQLPENVLILADIEEHHIKIISGEGFDEVTSPSEAVVSMLEQFSDLHSAIPVKPEFLVSIIEDSLAHIVNKSLTLVEMVTRDDTCTELTPDRVRTILGCDHSDLRLIVNVAAVYWPPVLSSVFG
ncbi:unnamed protein product [Caenorhabditis bovis]|uniref:UDENN FNIP1/2-type domain-containing protein n=1 Tax=Caenorhabditis bovis TaxID=2654633 RepID=A0A8S1EZU6_9PELO|nr:unnamed protein product [Caenorhabditis bovis]